MTAILTGNTPACAGKRTPVNPAAADSRKYPRVRGEKRFLLMSPQYDLEIPPRARGKGLK